jgi:hypothetical protein
VQYFFIFGALKSDRGGRLRAEREGKDGHMAQAQDEEVGARSFAFFAANLSDGDFNKDASEAQHELNKSLQDASLSMNMKVKGELTIKLKYSCDAKGNMGIDHDITIKKPKMKRPTAQAWMDPKTANAVFEPPRQLKLGLREVGGRGDLQEAAGERRPLKDV